MISEKNLEKILKAILKSGKVVIGTKEVLGSLKGSKLVISSSSLSKNSLSKIVETCESLSVPLFEFKGTSMDFGRICGKPFLVSAIAIKSSGEINLSPLIGQV